MAKENKESGGPPLPPPVLMAIFLVVALLFGRYLPVPLPFPGWMKIAGWVVTLGGFWIAVSALRALVQAHTSTDTHTPSSALVTTGPYLFSRNPIYLGFVMIVIGLPLILGYYWEAILSPVVIDAYNRLILEREELYLEHRFGQSYLEYKSRVRRWL